jgi:hypothetical protein
MLTDLFGITDFQGGGIDKTDPCAGSEAALQVGQERKQHTWNESDKASITDQMRKFFVQMHLNIFGVVCLERSIMRLLKMDENRHHLTWTELARSLSLLACGQLPSTAEQS